MFRITTVGLVVLCVCSAVLAQEAQQTQEPVTKDRVWTKVFTTGVYTRYFGTNGASFADEDVVQTNLDFSRNIRKVNIGFNVSSSKGFKTNWKDFSDEVDFTTRASWSCGSVAITGNTGVFLLVPQAKTNVITVGVKVAKGIHLGKKDEFVLFAKLDSFHLTNRKHPTMHGGKYPSAGLIYQHAFTQKVGAVVQYQYSLDVDGAFGFTKSVHIYRVDAAVNFAVGKMWTLSPTIIYGGTHNDPSRLGKTTFGFSLSKVF